MSANWKPDEWGLVSHSYWSPSAGNLLSAIVVALGLDMRVRRDAVEALRIICESSNDELLQIVASVGSTSYRNLRGEMLANIRLRAIAAAAACLDLAA